MAVAAPALAELIGRIGGRAAFDLVGPVWFTLVIPAKAGIQ